MRVPTGRRCLRWLPTFQVLLGEEGPRSAGFDVTHSFPKSQFRTLLGGSLSVDKGRGRRRPLGNLRTGSSSHRHARLSTDHPAHVFTSHRDSGALAFSHAYRERGPDCFLGGRDSVFWLTAQDGVRLSGGRLAGSPCGIFMDRPVVSGFKVER